jgi:hypothetical protein
MSFRVMLSNNWVEVGKGVGTSTRTEITRDKGVREGKLFGNGVFVSRKTTRKRNRGKTA